MARVPIVRLGDVLVAAVQDELYDHDALQLLQDLGERLEGSGARGVLLDLATVQTLDSFLARLVREIAAMARLMGAETVVAGIRPAVAITLLELGLELRGVHTALDAEKGLALLARLLAAERARGARRGR
jgi:rsbT antagonist protein RsbS